jgi:rubrerythrin
MPQESKSFTAYETLQSALKRERQAYEFYSRLAGDCRIEGLRELLEKLRDEENKHIKMIEKMLSQMRLGHDPL